MHLTSITITNFRCFGDGDNTFELPLKAGLTALVGENETGKTAVIDALRFALGTTDQEWYRLEDRDFYKADTSREIKIVCKFEELNDDDRRAFVECLTYEDGGKAVALYVHWTAKSTGETPKGKPYRRVETCASSKLHAARTYLESIDFQRADLNSLN